MVPWCGQVLRAWIPFALALAPSVAYAANGNMPRTPALFPPHECLTVVDRTRDATLDFAVHIPFEDTMITEDELADSRTFSFFALCRDPGPLAVLPNWIAWDDVDRSIAAGILEAPPTQDEVLLEAPAWSIGHATDERCAHDMTGTRTPISCAATMDGVTWDTTDVAPGNYVIRGYTFAPASNLWTERTGVVQVNDGAVLPVASLLSPTYDAQAYLDDGYRVIGCMDGPPGTTVTLQWASTFADDLEDDAAWTTFAELDAAEQVIDLQFMMPPETELLGVMVRAVARGPDGAQWIGHAPGFVTVYPGDGESDDPEVSAPPDHCMAGGDTSGGFPDTTTGDASSSSGDSTDTSTSLAQDDGGGSGCGCAPVRGRSWSQSWSLVLLFALRRCR